MLTRRKLIQAAGATAAGTLGGFDLAALAQEPLRIGFVYVSPVGEAGWTFQHDLGRKDGTCEDTERNGDRCNWGPTGTKFN